MSQQLISRNPDLKRLQDEGYEVAVHGSGHLTIAKVPFVNEQRQVVRGTLVSTLELAGDITRPPVDHTTFLVGTRPCDQDGAPLTKIIHIDGQHPLAPDLVASCGFSSKPAGGYQDYYAKMTAYINIIAAPAEMIDPSATARTFAVIEPSADESVFNYIDTASSRAGIADVTAKLNGPRVAIIGLGGTGSYILDLVAKTPVAEIHLFDGDDYLQHNAFRSPGAPSVEQLRGKPTKANYFAEVYSKMHRGIVSHPEFLDEANLTELDSMQFVFLSIDSGSAKLLIVEHLERIGVPFIDVGMGIWQSENGLGGSLRVTTSTPDYRTSRNRISFGDGDDKNEYARNIQIADLNALNAALAVIRWKKLLGFYVDLEKESTAIYTVDGNHLLNEDPIE